MRARVLSCLFLLILLAPPAVAAGRDAEGRPSFDRILPEIRRHTPGTFYDAEGPYFGRDGQARYRIKWMTPDGRVVWFDADARTGRVLAPLPYTNRGYGSGRYGDDGDGDDRYDDSRYGSGRYDSDRGSRDRYERSRRGGDRDDDNSNRFRNWPGYDRGQGDRSGRDRSQGGRDRDSGGSSRGSSGRGDSGRGHGGRH